MNEIPESIFDFSIPDWEYHTLIIGSIRTPIGLIDGLFIVYKDGEFKIKGRFLMPSGNKNIIHAPVESVEDAFNKINTFLNAIPMGKDPFSQLIMNPSLKGCDLFNLMFDCGALEITSEIVKR
jgi:hypothetical protein